VYLFILQNEVKLPTAVLYNEPDEEEEEKSK